MATRQQVTQGMKALKSLLLLVTLLFVLAPFAWLVASSFKEADQIFRAVPEWIPKPFTLRNYYWALGPTGPDMLVYIRNSLLAAAGSALLAGFLSTLAAYGLARYRIPGRNVILVSLLMFNIFKGPLVIVAWYRLGFVFGILDTPVILILAYAAFSLPLCTWLLQGFFHSVPRELEESAFVEGCGKLGALWRVTLPLAAPGIAAVTLWSFVLGWNDFIYALSLTTSDRAKTVQVALYELLGFFGQTEWGGLLASAVIGTLPSVVLFAFLQRYIIQGLAEGGVKG